MLLISQKNLKNRRCYFTPYFFIGTTRLQTYRFYKFNLLQTLLKAKK